MYYRSVFYVILMVVYGVLGYIFLDSGFNTKTKVRVDYEDNSNVYYDVKYLDDNYNDTDNGKYVSNMVNYIDMKYIYNNIISEYVSGYYKYNVEGYLIAYEDDITDSLWERKYELFKDKVVVIDQNDVNNIKIDDKLIIDYRKYRNEILDFIDEYDIDVNGYLHVRINIMEFLNFDNMDNEYADSKVISVNIPLTDDIFKIKVNNIDNVDSYYEFSSNKSMNIVFLVIGAFCLAMTVSSIVMVIRQFIVIYNNQNKYNKEINRILSKYEECIVCVKRFYVNRKYNMIYVSSFDELMDVYDKKNKMISFKETKKDKEAIFVIIDEDDAWIYKLIADEMK